MSESFSIAAGPAGIYMRYETFAELMSDDMWSDTQGRGRRRRGRRGRRERREQRRQAEAAGTAGATGVAGAIDRQKAGGGGLAAALSWPLLEFDARLGCWTVPFPYGGGERLLVERSLAAAGLPVER